MFKIIINNKKELIFENKISLKNLIIELNYKNIDYIYIDNEYVDQKYEPESSSMIKRQVELLLYNGRHIINK